MCFQMCWGRCVPKHVIVAIVLNLVKELFNVDWFFGLSQPTFCVATQTKKKKKKMLLLTQNHVQESSQFGLCVRFQPKFPSDLTKSEVGKWIWRWIWRTLFLFSGVQPGSRTGVNGSSGVQAECAGQRKQHNTMLQFFFYTFSSWIIHSELPDIDTIDSGWRATTAADAGRYVQALSLHTGFYRYFPGRTRC